MKNQLAKRILSVLLGVALICSALAFTACGNDEPEVKKVLNLYTWAGMFPDEILDGFEAATGIEVNYVTFDSDETMLQKLQAANGGDYDLIIADDYIIETAIAEGLVQKLDTAKIPSIGNVNPVYQGQFYDPTNEYTVPFGAGVQTIVYNPAKVDFEITGYSDLWNPALRDRIGIIGNFRVINGMALKTLDYSYNTTAIDEIQEAGARLRALSSNIRVIKDDNLQDDLLTGEVDVAVMYTSQVTLAKMTDPSLKVVYPSEGIGFGIMAMFIPSAAPDSDAAHQFIEYVLDPARGADCFEWLGYYCTFLASEEHIDPAFREFLTLPENIDTANMEMIENITPDAEEVHMNSWTWFREMCQ